MVKDRNRVKMKLNENVVKLVTTLNRVLFYFQTDKNFIRINKSRFRMFMTTKKQLAHLGSATLSSIKSKTGKLCSIRARTKKNGKLSVLSGIRLKIVQASSSIINEEMKENF